MALKIYGLKHPLSTSREYLRYRAQLTSQLRTGEAAKNLAQAHAFQKLFPQDGFANHVVAEALIAANRKFEAIPSAQAAVHCSDLHPPYVSCLARLYLEFGFLENLGPLLSKACAKSPDAAILMSDMADYNAAIGRPLEAAAHLRNGISKTDDAVFAEAMRCSLADVLRSAGQNEEAKKLLHHLAGTKAHKTFALTRLAQIPGAAAEKEIFAALRTELLNPALGNADRARLHLALGQLLEKSKKHSAAFLEWKKSRVLNSPKYQQQAISSLIVRLKRFYTPELFANLRAFASASAAPAFIVGLPRSGTTLMEQMIAGHSAANGVGELGRLGRRNLPFFDIYDRPGGVEQLQKNAMRGELIARADEFLTVARLIAKNEDGLLIDKMPTQFLAAGYIHLCLPQARFIHLKRHPADVFISTYENNFHHDYSFAFDEKAFAHFYAQYELIMAHWRSLLGAQILDVDYEVLVTDPESQLQRVTAFLGLEWEPEMLHFAGRSSSVRTFSRDQVRQGINRQSIGRWRNHETDLASLFAAFDEFGVTAPK